MATWLRRRACSGSRSPTVQRHTLPVADKLTTINGALTQLAGGLSAVDGHLAAAARVFRL